MIRPVVIAEYHQSKHNLVKGIVVFAGLAFVLRLVGGLWSAGMLLIVLLPNLGLGFGLGTFSEEFTKGQFKFLYSLPVKRFTIWWVKCVSALVSLAIFGSVICAVIFVSPSDDVRQLLDVFPALQLSPLSLIGFLASVCAYGFGVGFFSITACSSAKVAGIGSAILLYLPPLAIGASFYFLGRTVPFVGITFLLLAASACFCLGALALFLMRNPFVDAAWPRRCAALAIAGATSAFMTVFSAIAMSWPTDSLPPDFTNVLVAQASPDGKHIFVMTQERLIETHCYVITPDGKIEHDLGSATSMMSQPELTWCKRSDKLNIAYVNTPPIWNQLLVDTDVKAKYEISVLNLESGHVTRVPHLGAHLDDGYLQYHLWSPDGQRLLGSRTTRSGRKTEIHLIAQDVETGAVTEFGTATGDSVVSFLPSGHAVIHTWASGTQDTTELVIIDPQTGHRQAITLTTEFGDPQFEPDAGALMYVNKYFDDQSVGYEILRYTIATGDASVIIGRTDLPHGTLEQAARFRLGSVSFELSPRGNWMIYHTLDYDHNREGAYTLVDLRTHSRLVVPYIADDSSYSEWHFSPQEGRLLGVAALETDSDDLEDTDQIRHQMQIRILDLNSDELATIYSGSAVGYDISPQWLNDDLLIYLQADSDAGNLQTGRTLRRINVADGVNQQISPRQDVSTESHSP